MIEDNSIFVFEGVASDIAMRLNQWNWRIADLGKQHLHLCNTLHYDCQGSYRPLLLIAIILIFDSWSSPCSSVLVTYTVAGTDMFVKFKLQTENPGTRKLCKYHVSCPIDFFSQTSTQNMQQFPTHKNTCRVVSLCIWGEKKNWRYPSPPWGGEKGGWPYIGSKLLTLVIHWWINLSRESFH